MIGPVTSRIAATAAAIGDSPCSSCRSTFSTTTMASSTTSPIASTMPSMLTVLREKPRASITASVAISETGMAMAGMTVLRQLCRNRNTTAMTSASASPRVMTTSCIDAETKVVVSYLISQSMPVGKRLANSAILDRISRSTSSAFDPGV